MIGELVERRGFSTKEAAVAAGAEPLTDGLLVRVRFVEGAPRKRSWLLEAWPPHGARAGEAEAEAPEPDPDQQPLPLLLTPGTGEQ